MRASTVVFGLVATCFAAPHFKRAVFSATTYDALSISGGTAGNGQQEALAKLAGLPTDLTQVESSDLDFLNEVNQVANDAEDEAFNPAIDAASGEDADALQVSTRGRSGHKYDRANKLTCRVNTARQNQEQDPEADGDGAQAAGSGGTRPRRGGQAGRGADEAAEQHFAGRGRGWQPVDGA